MLPVVRLSTDQRVADLTLTVVPGPRVRVVFTGDSLPADRRAELVPVEREGSVDEDLLEDSSNRIEEYLRAQGYRDAGSAFARGDERRTADYLCRAAAAAVSRRSSKCRVTRSVPLADLDAVAADARGHSVLGAASSTRTSQADRRRLSPPWLCRGAGRSRRSTSSRRRRRRRRSRWRSASVSRRRRARLSSAVTLKAISRWPKPRCAGASACSRVRRLFGSSRPIAMRFSCLPEPRLPDRVGRRAAGLQPDRHARRDRVRGSRRAAGLRRSRAHRRQRADEHRHDRTRAAAQVRRSVQPRRSTTASGGCGARPVPPRRNHRTAPRRREQRATCSSRSKRRRRPPSATAAASRCGRSSWPSSRAAARRRTRRSRRARSFELGRRNVFGKNRSLNFLSSIAFHSQEQLDDLEYHRPRTYREPRIFDTRRRRVRERHLRAADSIELQLLAAQRQRAPSRGSSPPTVSVSGCYQIQRTPVFDEKLRYVRPAADRSRCSRMCCCPRSPRRSPGHAQTIPVDPSQRPIRQRQRSARRAERLDPRSASSSRSSRRKRFAGAACHGIVFAGERRFGLATGFPREASNGRESSQ